MVPLGILADPACRAAIIATMLLGPSLGYVYFTSLPPRGPWI